MIRRVRNSDKEYVLRYCTETFEWGDYIRDVWDDWLQSGVFLACEPFDKAGVVLQSDSGKTSNPVGICHASVSWGQVWIEGIRVHPQYRQRGVATLLVKTAENMTMHRDKDTCTGYAVGADPGVTVGFDGHNIADSCSDVDYEYDDDDDDDDDDDAISYSHITKERSVSRMLIETGNRKSLGMARRLGYSIANTWTYYRATPQLSKDVMYGNRNGDASDLIAFAACDLPHTADTAPAASVYDADSHDHTCRHHTHGCDCAKRTVEIYVPRQDLDTRVYSHCVRSWRWYETNPATLRHLASCGMVAVARPRYAGHPHPHPHPHHHNNQNPQGSQTVSISHISESVGGPGTTLYATVYPGSDDTPIHAMIEHLENVAARNSCASLNLFAPCALPLSAHLTNRHDFYLVEKRL